MNYICPLLWAWNKLPIYFLVSAILNFCFTCIAWLCLYWMNLTTRLRQNSLGKASWSLEYCRPTMPNIKHQNCYWYEVYCYSITSSRSNISFSPILSMSHRLLTLVWSWTILPWPRVKAMLFPGTNDKLSTFMGGTIFGSWNLNLSLLFCHSVESGPYFGGNMQHPIGLIKLILLFSNIAPKGFVEGTN